MIISNRIDKKLVINALKTTRANYVNIVFDSENKKQIVIIDRDIVLNIPTQN